MIKLPVILRGRSDPKETIGDAIAWLDELVTLAGAEEKETDDSPTVSVIQASRNRRTS